jgi:hypothetical protein
MQVLPTTFVYEMMIIIMFTKPGATFSVSNAYPNNIISVRN